MKPTDALLSLAWVALLWLPPGESVRAGGWEENFDNDPGARGWKAFGQVELFEWDASRGELRVTWDSARPNSYFYKPLGTVVSKRDDLRIAFDLLLDEVQVGTTPGQPYTFELAVGLIDLSGASRSEFRRGTATQSPNLLEFDYFPDSGFGATLSPVIVSSNGQFRPGFTFPFELEAGERYRVELIYTSASQTLATTVLRNGEATRPVQEVRLGADFTDFRVDTFAVCSYSDAGADGSVRARGRIDQVVVVVPDPPLTPMQGGFHQGRWQALFTGNTQWLYTLERTVDWRGWRSVSAGVPGTGRAQALEEDAPLPDGAAGFYRIRAERRE